MKRFLKYVATLFGFALAVNAQAADPLKTRIVAAHLIENGSEERHEEYSSYSGVVDAHHCGRFYRNANLQGIVLETLSFSHLIDGLTLVVSAKEPRRIVRIVDGNPHTKHGLDGKVDAAFEEENPYNPPQDAQIMDVPKSIDLKEPWLQPFFDCAVGSYYKEK